MPYIEGFVAAVPTANKDEYVKHAREASKYFKELGGTSVGIGLYVADVDAAVRRAVDAGATLTMRVEDKFYGDRYGTVRDPFGHEWQLATHKEDLTPEQIAKRSRLALGDRG